jgi:hypothetical protein
VKSAAVPCAGALSRQLRKLEPPMGHHSEPYADHESWIEHASAILEEARS